MKMLTLLSLFISFCSAMADSPKEMASKLDFTNAKKVYEQNCIGCHGGNRLGITGPPLIPQNFERGVGLEFVSKVIKEGRASTQMPSFSANLSDQQIAELSQYLLSPVDDKLVSWSLADMNKSLAVVNPENPQSLLKKAVDPLNLFTVVEIFDHQISILDGDKLEVLKRLPTKRGVHGGAKYSPDGRYMYLSSRDGWVEKFDMLRLEKVREIRVAINTRNIAISSDGKYVLAGNFLPHNLVLLNATDLKPMEVFAAERAGETSRVSAVYDAPPRKSFVVSLKDIPEIWEIPYSKAPKKENIRKISLKDKIENFSFNQEYTTLMGTAHDNTKGQVIDLVKGKKIADLDIKGMPHLGAGITFKYKGKTVVAAPNMKQGLLSIVDMKNWRTIKSIKTNGPGFFLRSHEKTPYAWADVFWGPHKDEIHVIDKRTLKVVKTLNPSPGKTAAHIEFDRYGKYALVSLWEDEGALIVYDAKTFKELKRIPMKKPSGKYNVYNKINFSEGTSH